MSVSKIKVNLLPRKELEQGFSGKFLEWVLNYGRYIIIGTFIIVLAAFLSRFKLDYDLSNLSDEIKNKQETIKRFGDLELKVRALQSRLALIKKIQGENLPYTKALNTLSQITPQDVIYSKLDFTSSKVSLSATALSLSGFSTFIEELKASKAFTSINLGKVGQGKGGIEFSLSAEYKK
ncbi:PilN domain-containing protein [Candidatus Microgenomates bacterium]|nr:PilN domain-containing protein [Candidatus Microgenomates bacterium]